MKRLEKISLRNNAIVLNEQEMKHILGGSTYWCEDKGFFGGQFMYADSEDDCLEKCRKAYGSGAMCTKYG